VAREGVAKKAPTHCLSDGIDSQDEQVRRCAMEALYEFADRFPT
jgi:hypothetical protein